MESENRKRKADELIVESPEGASHSDSSNNNNDNDKDHFKDKGKDETITNSTNVAQTESIKRTKVSSESVREENTPNDDNDDNDDNAREEIQNKEPASESNTEKLAFQVPANAETVGASKEENLIHSSTTSKDKPSSIFGATTGFSGFASVKSTSGFGFGSLGGSSPQKDGAPPSTTTSLGTNTLTGFQSATNQGFASLVGPKSSAFGNSTLGFGTAKGFGEIKPGPVSTFGTLVDRDTTNTSSSSVSADVVETSHAPLSGVVAAAATTTTAAPSTRPVLELPTNYEIKSGEEEETVLFEARCRTHRLVPAGAESKESAENKPAKSAPAVPPSQSLVGTSHNSANLNHHGAEASSETATSLSLSSSSLSETSWQEVGTGPLKVLKHTASGKIRLVQRREVSPSGPATKVILNAPLHTGDVSFLTKIHQPTEKHVQWTTAVEGKAVTFLFRFKTAMEATRMTQTISVPEPEQKKDTSASETTNNN